MPIVQIWDIRETALNYSKIFMVAANKYTFLPVGRDFTQRKGFIYEQHKQRTSKTAHNPASGERNQGSTPALPHISLEDTIAHRENLY